MEVLNDDCLCVILEYLTLSEQILMSKLSSKLCQVLCENVWRRPRYRKLAISDAILTPLSKEDYLYFFGLICPAMQEFYIGNVHREAFCTYLGRHLLRPELTYYMRLDYQNLREFCCLDDNMNNGMIRTLANHCPELRSLTVSSIYITGKHMVTMRKLENLVARRCSIEASCLNELLTQLQLRYLDLLLNSPKIEEAILEASRCSMLYLQKLRLSDSSDYGIQLAERLPTLQCLMVGYNDFKPDDKLITFIRAHNFASSNLITFPKRLKALQANCSEVDLALRQLCLSEHNSSYNFQEFSNTLLITYNFK